MDEIRNIFIVENQNKENSIQAVRIIKNNPFGLKVVNDINEANVVVSVGGDGSFLHASKIAIKYDLPIFGINTGTLGYLTEIDIDGINNALARIADGKYFIEGRMLLEGQINGTVISDNILNDVTISKNSYDIIRFSVYIDDILINKYTADGLIISTPTGSTAYNLSAGGPIIDPKSENIVLTPISPHTMINKSLVLSEKSTINIVLDEIRGKTNDALFVHDGDQISITVGDIMTVKQSEKTLLLLKFNRNSFLETIKNKMIN